MTITAEDHIAIQRLMFRYARCADCRDYDRFAEVFTVDASFDFSGRLVQGLPAIQEMMLALEKYSVTQHRVSNVLYAVNGDLAEGETYCLASHLLPEGEATIKLDMGITYRDRLRRKDGDWRIAHRQFQLHWSQRSVVEPG